MGPEHRGRAPVNELPAFLGDPSGVLIYHHCTGWSGGPDLFARLRCRKVLRYHNVTPAKFYEEFNESHARHCRLGREQLAALLQTRCDLYLSDSAYNQGELIALGAEPGRCRVIPPCPDVERLKDTVPDTAVLDACGDGRTNVLFVGRVAPNKGHAALIEAFAVYHDHYDADSRLLLVGREDPGLLAYSTRLRELADRLGVRDAVVFTGDASDSELKAYYQTADVFAITSEHEGFCVPLVEAMALGVPVVAAASTAIPGTLGSAGFVWPEADPFVLAGSMDRIVRDAAVRERLCAWGRRRYEAEFAGERIEAGFREAVQGLLPAA